MEPADWWTEEVTVYRDLLRSATTGLRVGETMRRRGVLVEMSHLPRYRVRPGMSTGVLQAEALSLISGSAPPDRIGDVVPQSAHLELYGPRTARQLPRLIEVLTTHRTRQAVLTIFRPLDVGGGEDPPCTTSLIFYGGSGQLLDVTVVMRSQDLWWRYPYDVLMFASLTRTLAPLCGLGEGSLTLFVADQYLRPGYEEMAAAYGTVITPDLTPWAARVVGRDLSDVRRRAKALLDGTEPPGIAESEVPLLTVGRHC